MSTDALIVKFFETLDEKCDKHCYVFYDHNLNTYAIRGGKKGGKSYRKTYSLYCDSYYDVYNFLEIIFSDAQNLNFSLMRHHELPLNSDDIDYDFLIESEINKTSEVIASKMLVSSYNWLVSSLNTESDLPMHIFNYDVYTNDETRDGDNKRTVGGFITTLLNTIRNVCNDYY